VSVEGEPKSFLPPALFFIVVKINFTGKKEGAESGEKFFV